LIKTLSRHFELIFWAASLIALGFSDPAQSHFSLCPLKALGITWCPGCGIGHAIAYLFRGDLSASFKAHWLGGPALGIIVYRILTLSVLRYRQYFLPR